MVVGSFAASVYGISRATHDLDIVIALKPDAIQTLANAFGEDFYFDEESAKSAVAHSDMFNIFHLESGLKIDFWILQDDEFNRTQFDRRIPTKAWGTESYVASPEDTILSKLLWYKITPSDRQLADVRAILTVQRDTLDYDYLRHWGTALDIEELLNSLIEEK